MNMQELAARYERMSRKYCVRVDPEGAAIYTALRGCALFIGDNRTPEQALDELELACELASRIREAHEESGQFQWGSRYSRQERIYRRAMAMVKKCEVAA